MLVGNFVSHWTTNRTWHPEVRWESVIEGRATRLALTDGLPHVCWGCRAWGLMERDREGLQKGHHCWIS